MAYTLALSDGVTTHDLNNSANYQVLEGGVSLPPPPKKQVWGGDNPYREGSDLIESRYHNRVITIRLRIKGTSDDNLLSAIRNLNDMLEGAKTYASIGRGTQVTLSYKLDAGTVTVMFDVLDGSLELPEDFHNTPMLDRGSMVVNATLRLTCKPFGRGAEETLENYARNPDMELGDGGNPLHDWVASNVLMTRSVIQVKHGTWAMRLLAQVVAPNHAVAYQDVTWAAAYQGQTFTLGAWCYCPAANSEIQYLMIDDGVGTTLSSAIPKTATWTWVTVTRTLNAAATRLRLLAYVSISGNTDNDDLLYVDQLIHAKASSLPAAWISGREVRNRNDPNNGDLGWQINYVDIAGIGGDAPGGLKLYVEEVQNETRMVFGARHGAEVGGILYLEQDGVVDATASNGEYLLISTGAGAVGYYSMTPAISVSLLATGLFRVFARINRSTANITKFGLGWTLGVNSYTPAIGEYVASVAGYNWYDLGAITIPPVDLPSGEVWPSFYINIWAYRSSAVNENAYLDVIMLFPVRVGEGYVVADHAAATKQILLDSTSARRQVFIMTAADVVDGAPAALLGTPAYVDPVATRIHLLAPGTQPLTDAFLVSAKVTPRYLLI